MHRRLMQVCHSEQDVRHSSWKKKGGGEERLAGDEGRSRSGEKDAERRGSKALL